MKIAIIGSGVFGISNAIRLSNNKDNEIMIWSESEEVISNIENNRYNYKPLNNALIPDSIKFSTSYQTVLENASIVLIMTSIKYFKEVITNMLPYINDNMIFLIGSKGIDSKSNMFIHEIFENTLNTDNYAIMAGPTFAIDVASNNSIGYTIASKNKEVVNKINQIYKDTNTKIEYTTDLITIELFSTLKNIIAISNGILKGLNTNYSTSCLYLTISLKEIINILDNFKVINSPIISYGAIGDFILTTTSDNSRNYTFGTLIGEHNITEANEFISNNTVEGYDSLISLYNLLNNKNISNTLVNTLYDIIINNEDPNKLLEYIKRR